MPYTDGIISSVKLFNGVVKLPWMFFVLEQIEPKWQSIHGRSTDSAYKSEPVVSFRKTRRVEEMVRRTEELDVKGVNFCELRKKEHKAVNPSWDAQTKE